MYFQSVNGVEIDQISTYDRGLAYGDGLFTTAKIVDGCVQMLSQHIERLRHGCNILKIQGCNFSTVESHLVDVAHRYETAVLKVMVTAGEGGRGYSRQGTSSPNIIVKVAAFPTHYYDWQKNGIVMCDASIQLGLNPLFAGLKHLNRLEQVLIRDELDQKDVDDLFVYDLNNNLIETSCANVFWFEAGQLFTPEIKTSGVAGLIRAKIIKHFPNTKIIQATHNNLKCADAIFITNSVMEIVPVRQYQGTELDMDKVHQFSAQFKRLIHD